MIDCTIFSSPQHIVEVKFVSLYVSVVASIVWLLCFVKFIGVGQQPEQLLRDLPSS